MCNQELKCQWKLTSGRRAFITKVAVSSSTTHCLVANPRRRRWCFCPSPTESNSKSFSLHTKPLTIRPPPTLLTITLLIIVCVLKSKLFFSSEPSSKPGGQSLVHSCPLPLEFITFKYSRLHWLHFKTLFKPYTDNPSIWAFLKMYFYKYNKFFLFFLSSSCSCSIPQEYP